MAIDGFIMRASRDGPAETLRRLESSIAARGLTIFARIDHADGAGKVGLQLRPTEVVIFGSAQGGTPMMQLSQSIGLDLPLKMLVWRDANDQTLVAYDDPAWLARRFGLGEEADPVVARVQAALSAIAREAAGEAT